MRAGYGLVKRRDGVREIGREREFLRRLGNSFIAPTLYEISPFRRILRSTTITICTRVYSDTNNA